MRAVILTVHHILTSIFLKNDKKTRFIWREIILPFFLRGDMMFYRLKSEYMLRGWKLLHTGVVNREDRKVKFLPSKKYNVLKLCDGKSASDLFDEAQRKIIDEFIADGYVEVTDKISPLEAVQEYKFHDNRFVSSMGWYITGKCNCKCRHCYLSSSPQKVEEFTHEQCMNIIAQMAECGVQNVSLIGGEPLIRRDFWEIVDELVAKDIKIKTILSNGILINEKFISELKSRDLRPKLKISFDGIGCHDWLRGFNGAEKAFYRAVKLLHEGNFKVHVSFDLHKGNLGSVRESVKLLASMGVDLVDIGRIFAMGAALDMQDKLMTRAEEHDFLLEYIPQYIADGAPVELHLSGIFSVFNTTEYMTPIVKMAENFNCDNYCLCGNARNFMKIDSDGYVIPCIPMGLAEGSKKYFSRITDKSLKEILNDEAYMRLVNTRLGEYFKRHPECADCEYKNRCGGGCRGMAMYYNRDGDIFGIDKDTCKFFKGGYYDKVVALAKSLGLKRIA